jgi:hypothetical protein
MVNSTTSTGQTLINHPISQHGRQFDQQWQPEQAME